MRSHCRNLARVDLYFLLRYGCRREDTQRQWILDRCREVQANPNGYLDLWAREHYKSSILTFAYNIQRILRSHGDDPLDPEECTIGILSYNRPTAKSFLRQIKYELEINGVLKEWFPDILWVDPKKDSPKWSEDEGIVVKRKSNPKEATVEAWGLVDGMPTGKHFSDLDYDDVVTERSVTEGMTKKTTDAWELSLNLGRDGGYKRYKGTRYADGDTYGTMLERGVAIPRIHPATDDGTAAGKPVLFTPDYLEERRLSLSPYNFACQLLLDPIPSEDAYFTRDMLRYYRWDDRHKIYGPKYMASDWATTHGGGDYTVHGVGQVDPEGDLYIVDWWRAQRDTADSADAWLGMLKKHKPRDYVAEKAQIEKSVGPFLRRYQRDEQAFHSAEALYTSHQDKATKAQSIRGRMAHQKVLIPEDAPWSTDLISELLRFPHGVHDDQVDVMGLFGRHLDSIVRGRAPKKPGKPRGMTFDDIEKQERYARLGLPVKKVAYYAGK